MSFEGVGLRQRHGLYEACLEEYNLHGLYLRKGIHVSVILKGRNPREIVCEFICFNPIFATFVLKCGDVYKLLKYSEIRYMSVDISEITKALEERKKELEGRQ